MTKIILIKLLLLCMVNSAFANINLWGLDNSDTLKHDSIETSVSYSMGGRSIEKAPFPDKDSIQAGRYSFDIRINRNGEVIEAVFNTRVSNHCTKHIKKRLYDAAMSTRFSVDNYAPEIQKGDITYNFLEKKKKKR